MPTRFSLLALFALLLAPAAHAQTSRVEGRIVDGESGGALPTATVAMWQFTATDSSLVGGMSASMDGSFSIDAAPGDYTLVVSFIGYQTVRRDVALGGSALSVGDLSLAPDARVLGEVQVSAERSQVSARIDRTVYNTSDSPVTSGGSATDVLSTIPSIDVDLDGNVSLRGAGSVAIFINGRPAPVSGDFIAAYLRSLPAGSIERVEVIPNPSAAFEPDGVGGILNVVLKQNTDLGMGGTLTAGTDSQGGYNATAALTYGRGPWSLAGTYGFRSDDRDRAGSSFRINRYESSPTTLRQDESENRTRSSHFVSLSADYALSDATTLTSQVQAGIQSGNQDELSNTLRASAIGAPLMQFDRLALEESDGLSGDVRLGVRHRFGEEHTLTVEARGQAEEEGELQTFSETLLTGNGELELPQRVDESDSEREVSLRADYTVGLGAIRLDVGYAGGWEYEASDLVSETQRGGVFTLDDNLNNSYTFDETVHALYLQAAREWGQIGLQVGVRAEQATTTFDLETTDESFGNDYASLFPSAYLSYKPSELTNVRAGYSRRINRPRRWELNPFPSFSDPRNIRQGNPSLKPEYTESFEIRASHVTDFGSLSLTPYYRHTTDIIRRISTVRPDGVTVRSTRNLDTADAWGAEGVVSFDDVFGLEGYVSMEGYRLQTEGDAIAGDALGWGGRANASYAFGDPFGIGGLDLQATFRYTAPVDTEQGRTGARTFFDFALRQKLMNDRAALTLQVRDPLALAGFQYTLDQPDLYQEIDRDWGAQQVGLTFSYTFGQQERQRDTNRDGGGDYGGEEY